MRVGFGYDSHRFGEGRRLILGGVEIPYEKGLLGHSDADALIHAIIDALFGAAALGDIGSHFPDTDEKWRGADSARLLESAVGEVRAAGWELVNVDATVICERPKLLPHIPAIRARLAEILFPGEADGVSRIRRMFVLLDGQCVYPDETDYSLNMAELMASMDDGWLNRFKRAFRCLVPTKVGHGESIWASCYGDILDGRLDRFCKE